jgi:4-hydroxyphenylpyruvate dioxygenase
MPARAAADLREMAERAAKRGLLVGYEALAWGGHVNRWRQAWDIVQQADHAALGLILDSFHTLALGDDLSALAGTVPAEKLFFVQLADAPRLAMDPALLEPPLPQLPRPGRIARRGLPA